MPGLRGGYVGRLLDVRRRAAAIALTIGLVLTAAGPYLDGGPAPHIHVRWRSDVTTGQRWMYEWFLSLGADGRGGDGRSFGYDLLDPSPENVRAILEHAAIEDTHNLLREGFAVAATAGFGDSRTGIAWRWRVGWLGTVGQPAGFALLAVGVLLLIPWTGPALPQVSRVTMKIGARCLAFRPTRRQAVMAAAAALGLLTFGIRVLEFSGFSNDQFMHLALAQQWLMGDAPVRDFQDPGMPLTYLTSAAALFLGNGSLLSELVLSSVAFALAAALTVVVGFEMTGSMWMGAAVAGLEVAAFPRLYSYPKVLVYVAGAFVLLRLAREPSVRRIVAAAALTAVAFLFRHDHGAYLGIMFASALVLRHWREPRAAFRHCAQLGAVTLLFLLPWMVYVALNGGLARYFGRGVAFSIAEFQRTQTSLAPWDLNSLLTGGPLMDQIAERWVYSVFITLPLVCAYLAFVRGARSGVGPRRDVPVVVPLALLGALVTWGFVRNNLEARLPDAIVPPVLLGGWLVTRTYSTATRTVVIVLATVSVVCLLWLGDIGEHINRSGISTASGIRSRLTWLRDRRDRPDLLVKGQLVRGLSPVLPFIERCTASDDRLVVTGNAPDVYVVARRRFAGRSPFFEPGYYESAEEQQVALDAIERARVPVILVDLRTFDVFRRAFTLVAAGLERSYVPFTDAPFERATGIRMLSRRADRGPALDDETGWPCPVLGRRVR